MQPTRALVWGLCAACSFDPGAGMEAPGFNPGAGASAPLHDAASGIDSVSCEERRAAGADAAQRDATLAWRDVETLIVPVDGAQVMSNTVLQGGVGYRLRAAGSGAPLVAQLHDGKYANNSGAVTLTILVRQ